MMTKGNAEKVLTPKQLRALESLLTDGTVQAAALAAGVSRKTLYVWLGQTEFSAQLRRLEGELLQSMGRRLLALGEEAHDAVSDGLNASQRINTRLRAAQLVYEHGSRLSELIQIVSRIEALERRGEI